MLKICFPSVIEDFVIVWFLIRASSLGRLLFTSGHFEIVFCFFCHANFQILPAKSPSLENVRNSLNVGHFNFHEVRLQSSFPLSPFSTPTESLITRMTNGVKYVLALIRQLLNNLLKTHENTKLWYAKQILWSITVTLIEGDFTLVPGTTVWVKVTGRR